MSDNLRRYRAIRAALLQGYPGQPTGRAWRCWGYTVHSGRIAHIPPNCVVALLRPRREVSSGDPMDMAPSCEVRFRAIHHEALSS